MWNGWMNSWWNVVSVRCSFSDFILPRFLLSYSLSVLCFSETYLVHTIGMEKVFFEFHSLWNYSKRFLHTHERGKKFDAWTHLRWKMTWIHGCMQSSRVTYPFVHINGYMWTTNDILHLIVDVKFSNSQNDLFNECFSSHIFHSIIHSTIHSKCDIFS